MCTGTNTHTNSNVPQNIYVGNNLITGGGRIFPAGYAVLVGDAHHVLVEHNEISDFYNNGVGVGFNWGWACNFAHDDVVRYNYIHDLGQGVTSDLGAVYYLSGANTGNAILNNRVHDIVHDPNGGYGGWGLYVGCGGGRRAGPEQPGVSHYRCQPSCECMEHAAAESVQPNTFKNNILAYGAMGVMDRHNDTNFLNVVYENNIFYYDKNTGDANSVQYGYWYCQGKTVCTSYFLFNNNIYFNKSFGGGQPAQPFFKTPVFPMNGVSSRQSRRSLSSNGRRKARIRGRYLPIRCLLIPLRALTTTRCNRIHPRAVWVRHLRSQPGGPPADGNLEGAGERAWIPDADPGNHRFLTHIT